MYDPPQACFEGERVTPTCESTMQYLRPSRPSSPKVSTDITFLPPGGHRPNQLFKQMEAVAMPYKKIIVCLANSRKRFPNRVAGKELQRDKFGAWARPVSDLAGALIGIKIQGGGFPVTNLRLSLRD